MKRVYLLAVLVFLGLSELSACPNITPRFTFSNSHSCGIPAVLSITNTSTGSFASSTNTTYLWKVNGKIADTTTGLAAPSTVLITKTGLSSIEIISIDSTGCRDSFTSTTTITTSAPTIKDGNGAYSHTPEWLNCIQFRTDSDSFLVKLESADTLHKPLVIWGDGTIDSSSKIVPGDSLHHYYTSTGLFTYKVVLYNPSTNCTDTLYGKVINQRQPTAGITGPVSGQNRGCVPHTITYKNNSYNVTSETSIIWQFGDGNTAIQNAVTDPDSISHTYTEPLCNGIVTLIATNVCGQSQTTWNPIDISDKDKAQIGVDTVNCDKKEPYIFHNLSTDVYCNKPDPKSYFWDFGDGDTTGWIFSKASQTHIYDEPGEYTVMLIAKNLCGIDTTYFTFTAIFDPEPNFAIDTTDGCAPITSTVTDLSKGWKVQRSWDFGDGNTSTDSIASNTYTKGGVYTLKLTATNSCGAKDTSIDIHVYEAPKADFAIRGVGCIPYNQQFYNNSTVFTDSTTYLWNFGDGTTSIEKDPPGKLYSIAGKYKITLDITNTCGVDRDSANPEVFDFPSITAIADSTICTFDSLELILNASLNSTYTVNWGDGNTSTSANDTMYHAYQLAGTQEIVIAAKGPGGCTSYDTLQVVVKPGAFAKFGVDKSFDCAPAIFTISDSSKNSTDYWWYINDSLVNTTNSFSSVNILSDSTIRTIKLKTKNAGYCGADSFQLDIFTPLDPISSYSLTDTWSCGPFDLQIANNSGNANTYAWSFGDNNTSSDFVPSITLSASKSQDTTYLSQLIAYNWAGCADTSQLYIGVYPHPTVKFTANHLDGCGPLANTFINNSTPGDTGSIHIMNFTWNFGDGSSSTNVNPSHSFAPAQTRDTLYNVKLIGSSEHGCKDTTEIQVKVYPKPIAQFTTDKNAGCGPLQIEITNLSRPQDTGSIDIMSFDWNFNSGTSQSVNPSATFTASQSADTLHDIMLVASSEHGCKDTTSQSITVYPNPKAQFTFTNNEGCTPFTPEITNNSIPNDTGSIQIMSFNWELGNGQFSTATNPSSTYFNTTNTDSIYTIQLEAISEHGCKDQTSLNITVHPKPLSNFNVGNNNACGPVEIDFTSTSVNVDSIVWGIDQVWTPGGNVMNHTFYPSLLFDTIYQVSITGKSIYGCVSDTVTKPVRIIGSPKAQFFLSKDTSCNEVPTLFYNTSLAAYKYDWNFGDGSTSQLINPSKTFKADNANGLAKTYSIELVATNIFGCTDTANGFFTATPLPEAIITLDNQEGCGELEIKFTNNSKFGNTQKWSFGEGSTSTEANPSFTFTNNTPSAKKYLITLESFAQAGCNAIDTATITVHPKPFVMVQSNRTNVCDSGGFDFIASGPNVSELDWDFGDGQKVTNTAVNGAPTRHYFKRSTYGDTSYTVLAIAKSSKGCSDSTTLTVQLNPIVFADFDQTPDEDCVPAVATFTNKSRNATNYVWEFGDGAGSGDTNPQHVYEKAGLYSVKLTAFDKNGCKSVRYGKNNFHARETPIAEFVMSPGQLKLPNAKATFSNLTVTSQPATYEWDFGDGATSTNVNPIHTYTDTGIYKVKLLAKNNVCQDVIIKQIIVDPSLPIADFDPDGAVGCAPLTVKFNEKSQYATKFTWHFGDGQSSNEANPTHVYENDGFYTVTLIVEGPGGVGRIIKTNIIEVKVTPRCYFHATPDSAFLPNARFDMKNNSINATSYAWELNNSSTDLLVATSTAKEPSFIINEKGRYDVTLMATNNNNCHDTLEKPLLLIVLNQGKIYVPTAFTPNRDNINDDFKPVMTGVNTKDYVFRIYNRWGEKIFETTDINAAWDGTLNQKNIAENVFIWTVSGKFADGTYFNEKGTVTLLR